MHARLDGRCVLVLHALLQLLAQFELSRTRPTFRDLPISKQRFDQSVARGCAALQVAICGYGFGFARTKFCCSRLQPTRPCQSMS